jgi:hypothetical protein
MKLDRDHRSAGADQVPGDHAMTGAEVDDEIARSDPGERNKAAGFAIA